MGMKLFSSSSNQWSPDLTDYTVLWLYLGDAGCALRVRYRNATNCGGEKILVFNRPYDEVKGKGMDPHFEWGDSRKLFARFMPTQQGWEAAIGLVRSFHRMAPE